MPGKKKGKKSKTAKSKGKSGASSAVTEPIPAPPKLEYAIPRPGEKLIKLLTTHKVGEKELHGFKVSTRALEQLTPQEIRDLKLVYDTFDIQDKGKMASPELKKAMKVLGFKVSKEQSRKIVRDVGSKHHGFLDFNEFLDVVIEQQGDSRDVYDEILQGFKMFDYDKTSAISLDNLTQACYEAGVKLAKPDLQDMMEEADQNGDGIVDKEEFIKIMLQTNLF